MTAVHFHFSLRPSKIPASYNKDNWPMLSDDHPAISGVALNIVPWNIRDILDYSSKKKGMREMLGTDVCLFMCQFEKLHSVTVVIVINKRRCGDWKSERGEPSA